MSKTNRRQVDRSLDSTRDVTLSTAQHAAALVDRSWCDHAPAAVCHRARDAEKLDCAGVMNRKVRRALTGVIEATARARAEANANFCNALLNEGIETVLAGDGTPASDPARLHQGDAGLEQLARKPGLSPKSLVHMFRPVGNARARYLFGVT